MNRTRMIGLASVIALVLVAAGTVIVVGGDAEEAEDPAPDAAANPAPDASASARPKPTAAPDRRLVLADEDNPVIWVRKGHQVQIHSAPGGPVAKTVGHETEFGSPSVFLVMRTQGEWAGVPNPFTGNGTLGWIRLDGRDLETGYAVEEIVVDLSERRAELWRGGELLRAFTVSVGAPGTETPTGRFAVTDTLRGHLNPAYGCCAVALTAEQPNLPSGWLGGNRIAIHGTSGPLGSAISAGCVRAADRDVSKLVDLVPPGAPVLVRQ
jgi:L,D-transpeptidase catalytic domain